MNMIYYNDFFNKTVGNIICASIEDKLICVDINTNRMKDIAEKLNFETKKDINSNKNAIAQINEYLEGSRKKFGIETEFLIGTKFQKKVWRELLNIPYGKVITYKDLAVKLGNPNASRAVGSAISKNLIPIIFPCHRVINSNGKLGGFSCGIEAKKNLLKIEQLNIHFNIAELF